MNDDVRESFEDVPERHRATVDAIRDLVLDGRRPILSVLLRAPSP